MTKLPCVAHARKVISVRDGPNKIYRAIAERQYVWRPGAKGLITLTFGLKRCPGCSPEAAWSNVGSQSLNVNKNDPSSDKPTMNLGFIDPPFDTFSFEDKTYDKKLFTYDTRNYCEGPEIQSCNEGWVPGATVIHEFCHSLGMLHEHQNDLFKSNPVELNRDAVIRYYRGIGMTEDDAITNVLEVYNCAEGTDPSEGTPPECRYIGTKFDPESIMMYALPDDWIQAKYFKQFGNPTYANFILSKTDRKFLSDTYNSTNYPELTVKFMDKSNEVLWKQAFVKKMIVEHLLPHVNIIFKFINIDDTSKTYGPDFIYKTIKDGDRSIAMAPEETEDEDTEDDASERPSTERPSTERPSTERPSTERPGPSISVEGRNKVSGSEKLIQDLKEIKGLMNPNRSAQKKAQKAQNFKDTKKQQIKENFNAGPKFTFLILLLICFYVLLMIWYYKRNRS